MRVLMVVSVILVLCGCVRRRHRVPAPVVIIVVSRDCHPGSELWLAVAAALRDGLTQPDAAKGSAIPHRAPPSLSLLLTGAANDGQPTL